MKIINKVLNEQTGSNVTCILQDVGGKYQFTKRPAIIIIPGGAYAYCSDREAEPVALRYGSYGYQTFILRYTCKDQGTWPTPLDEYEQTYQLLIDNQEQWAIDVSRIATIGFSAGGHLAACTATIAKNKPAATILIYPVILQDLADCCMPDIPSLDDKVDYDTVPCFIAACRDDPTVHISNALAFETALAKKGIPFESHIYSFGGHGFSIVDTVNAPDTTSERAANWFKDSIGWLDENFGKLTKEGFGPREKRVGKNGDCQTRLSIECSLDHLLDQSEEVQEVIQPVLAKIQEAADEGDLKPESIINAFRYNTLSQIMNEFQFDQEESDEIVKKLQTFINEK